MSNQWNPSDVFNVKSGDLVEFKYNGGTHPGSSRVVVVKTVDDNSLSGEDVFCDDKNKYRKFELGKIYEFKVLRSKLAVKTVATYDSNNGLVFKNKRGDCLSLVINPNGFFVSYQPAGKTSDQMRVSSFSLPNEVDFIISDALNLIKNFSV